MAKILVIDDDRAVLNTIRILLEHDAHEVETVIDGRMGLRMLGTQSFDLLIVDIFMPGMDGFETMRLVHRSWPKMPIVVMSGMLFGSASEGGPDFLHMATKLGAVSSLQKPFKSGDVLAAISKGLSDAAERARASVAPQENDYRTGQ
jgi:DNA-binding NtrC family response regulator